MWRYLLATCWVVGVAGCDQPDCQQVCEHTLHCDLTFAPGDDPQLRQVESGQRTAQASCEQGCRESLAIDERREQCLLAVATADVGRCRAQMLDCLGLLPQDAN